MLFEKFPAVFVAGIVLMLPLQAISGPSDPLERINISRAEFLCEWRHKHAPPNPSPLDICESHDVSPGVTEQQVKDWWQYWSRLGEHAVDQLKQDFEYDWGDSRREESAALTKINDAAAEREFARGISKRSAAELCDAYHENRFKAAKLELRKRGSFSEPEWRSIDAHSVDIGMSELALLCSWGTTEVNRTVNARGVFKQYVHPSAYIYVFNKRVVSYQDHISH